eukprot:evm.model.scf_298.14 EVM.evm.TU.scf_298.14   scf_298:90564-95590(-)
MPGSLSSRARSATREEADVEHQSMGGDLEGGMGEKGGEAGQRKGSGAGRGLKASPELFAIGLVYFVQGIVFLSRLSMSYFLKDTLHQDPSTVALLEGLGKVPWVIKPVYGIVSDAVPVFGYRRRSYIALCGLFGAFGWMSLATSVDSAFGAVLFMGIASLGTAWSDVVVDSLVVEKARGEPQATAGSLQSLCWASCAAGGLVSSYASGFLIDNYGPRFVFGVIAAFPLVISCSSLLVREHRITGRAMVPEGSSLVSQSQDLAATLLKQLKALWQAFRKPEIAAPALFAFVYMATPSPGSAMFFFETNELHFSPEFMGRIAFFGQIAQLAGVGIYNYFLKDVPLKKVFLWTSILGTVLGMTQLVLVTRMNLAWGLSDQLFVVGDSVLLDVLGQVSFMPVLVLAARLCPEGVEASLFALLMSILNGGTFTSQGLGGLLTRWLGVTSDDFTNLALLVAVCVVSSLAPLPLLRLLPSGEVDDMKSKKEGI